jgi:hypothetical protein
MRSAIIVDEGAPDSAAAPIAAVLAKHGQAQTFTLAEFLNRAGVCFNTETGFLEWDPSAFDQGFEGRRPDLICNRVVKISDETLAALDGSSNVLTANFALNAYARVLAQTPNVWGSLDAYPAGHALPLNLQWRALSGRVPDIGTPRFIYGFGAETVDVSDFREPLWKSPFDLYTWKAVDGGTRQELHAFVIDKPAGEPVVSYFVGSQSDSFKLRSGADLDADEVVLEKIRRGVEAAGDLFKAYMGECLFFVDGQDVVFAAFSQHMKTSVAHDRFLATVERSLS